MGWVGKGKWSPSRGGPTLKNFSKIIPIFFGRVSLIWFISHKLLFVDICKSFVTERRTTPSNLRLVKTLLMRGRQVHRGAAELYLSSHRINNAAESAVDYRVQLQRYVDEEGGKYTEAKPRCTCPLSKSTLCQGRCGPPPLLCDFILVHWRNSWFIFCSELDKEFTPKTLMRNSFHR